MSEMKGYTDLTVSTADLYDGYTAPEEMCRRAAHAWYRAFEMSDLTSLAGELDKAHKTDDGRWILGWIVGEDEYYYYVIFDADNHKVVTEKRQKAVKRASA